MDTFEWVGSGEILGGGGEFVSTGIAESARAEFGAESTFWWVEKVEERLEHLIKYSC